VDDGVGVGDELSVAGDEDELVRVLRHDHSNVHGDVQALAACPT
jgi:hypothetical protein